MTGPIRSNGVIMQVVYLPDTGDAYLTSDSVTALLRGVASTVAEAAVDTQDPHLAQCACYLSAQADAVDTHVLEAQVLAADRPRPRRPWRR